LKEGISWHKVNFSDNLSIIDLMEKKPEGILSILGKKMNE